MAGLDLRDLDRYLASTGQKISDLPTITPSSNGSPRTAGGKRSYALSNAWLPAVMCQCGQRPPAPDSALCPECIASN